MIKKLLASLVFGLAAIAGAQSHVFPATDTNNTFTGPNTFTNTVTLSGAIAGQTIYGTADPSLTCSPSSIYAGHYFLRTDNGKLFHCDGAISTWVAISGTGTGTCNVATTGTVGCVKPDGSTITIDVDGTIHVANASTLWSAILNPTGNEALSMAGFSTTFTWGATTGSGDMFTETDTTGNTGTGILHHVKTASGSGMTPFCADSNGTGWCVMPDGSLKGIGATTHYAIIPGNSSPPSGVAGAAVIDADASGNLRTNKGSTSASIVCTAANIGSVDCPSVALTTVGDSGQASQSGTGLNIPAIHGGNVFFAPNFMSLIGAFTDSSGNVIQPIAIGNGPVTFTVPYGATQLQLGTNDVAYSDDTGSWVISVNGTNYTVGAKAAPWEHTSGINAKFPTLALSNTSPVIATIGAVGLPVVIQYVSGTVSSPISSPLCGGIGPVSVDAAGETGCAPNYDSVDGGFFPSYWALSQTTTGLPSVAWGSITGTLLAQTDLNSALAAKASATASILINSVTCTLSGSCTIPTSSGGYTNVTGSVSQTTVAQINTACGTGTYYATTPLSIATGGTVTCGGTQFSKSGLWTIASGQVVTFTKMPTDTDGASQHFAGSGTVVLPAGNAPFIWWGAVGDGTTDEHLAMQACFDALTNGECQGGAGKDYFIGTSTLTITASNKSLGGGASPFGASSITSSPTYITTHSATATMLYMHGTAINAGEIIGNRIHDIQFRGNVLRPTAKNLDIEYTEGLRLERTWSNDAFYNFYIVDPHGAFIDSNWSLYGAQGLTETSGNLFGWEFFSPTNVGYYSPTFTNNFSVSSVGVSAIVYSYHWDGDLLSDFNGKNNQAFRTSYGPYLDGTATGGGFHMSDFHFTDSTVDTVSVACLVVTGLDATNEAAADFGGSNWCSSTAGNYGLDILNSQNVNVGGWQVYPNGGMGISMIHLLGSSRVTVNNNHTFGGYASFHNPSQSLVVDGGGVNTITSNSFTINASGNICNVEFKNTSVRNAFSGNAMSGGTTGSNGVCADATSSFNGPNGFDAYTVPVVDLGTSNNFTGSGGGTTTNALTMNNGGAGAASGSTFNGSAAKTISYNTLGAAPLASPTFTGTVIIPTGASISGFAPLASPTFTGTPAAPTATGGTNTTQLATTAFVQAAIAAAGTGAGIVTYSGPSLTFTGTQFFPIGGGGLTSTTETNVDIDAPAAVTIQNMTVQMSAAPGVGNTVVYTWRKNASDTVLTCTITGASATSCSDTTHNFSTASLDLLSIKAVTTGTIVGTPTVVMAAQIGVAATATTAFSSISGGTNTTAAMVAGSGSSIDFSGTGTNNASKINGVTVTGTPSVGYVPTATSSSAATWQAAGGGGSFTSLLGAVTPSGCTVTGSHCTVTGSSAASMGFSSIPGTYTDLQLRCTGQSTVASSVGLMNVTFNGDTGSNYNDAYTGSDSGQNNGVTNWVLGILPSSTTYAHGTSQQPGSGVADIFMYASTLYDKEFHVRYAYAGTAAVTNWKTYILSGTWSPSAPAAITSITITPSTGNWAIGSTCELNGVN